MGNQHQFWMVYVDGKNMPTVRHTDFNTAEAEAMRLAKLNPGLPIYALEAKAMYMTGDVPVERFSLVNNDDD